LLLFLSQHDHRDLGKGDMISASQPPAAATTTTTIAVVLLEHSGVSVVRQL